MAVIELAKPDRASRSKAFVSKQTTSEHKSFRLPADRITELRILFVDIEGMMGAKSCALDPLGDPGESTTATGVDSEVELAGAEQWCAIPERQKRGLAKAYRTLIAVSRRDWMVLWRTYGPKDPNLICAADFPSETAPLVQFSDVVEARRREMVAALIEGRLERAERASLLYHAALSCEARACAWHASEAAIRRGADSEITRLGALSDALHVKETGDAHAKQAIRDARKSFVGKATRQADRLLADASVNFQKMWWSL